MNTLVWFPKTLNWNLIQLLHTTKNQTHFLWEKKVEVLCKNCFFRLTNFYCLVLRLHSGFLRQSRLENTKEIETNSTFFIASPYSASNSDDSQRWRHVDRHTRRRGSHAPVPLQPGLFQPRIHLLLGAKLAALRKRRCGWEIAEFNIQVSNET